MSITAAIALAVAALVVSSAAWDFGRRWIAHRTHANQALADDFAKQLSEQNDKYHLALNEMHKQTQGEIDSIAIEIDGCRGLIYGRTGGTAPKGPEVWQQAGIDKRQQLRKQKRAS